MTANASPRAGHGAVPWLAAQTVLFGATAALLAIAANALFLDAYGPGWLPVTYIAIGVAGVAVSGAIAGGASRFDLVRIAVVVLGLAAAIIGIAWAVAGRPDGAWVSAPLLVLFPILIQLGFVFVGGQAGRVLDIAQIKASFPRIMTAFPVGAVIGGALGGPLVDVLGGTHDLLLVAALAQAGFAGLVWVTGRRFAAALAVTAPPPSPSTGTAADATREEDRGLRALLRHPFVALILGYQLLSALGSQLADYLVFDRAVVAFPTADDLARFVAGYTAVMNAVSIAFLFLVAGPLLRRFGLRLGIAANPGALVVFAIAMVVVLATAGAASFALLGVVSAARIADIAFTDGTTRTSINALYQVLPERSRLAAQTAVEGIGVPVAIGLSGVVIIVLNALPAALASMVVVLTLVCVAWTWVGLRLYGAYGAALADALRGRRYLDDDVAFDAGVADGVVARRLLVSADPRTARLGLDLAATMTSDVLGPELAMLAADPRADVRLAALTGLASTGDARARRRLAVEVGAAPGSTDAPLRLRAAVAMGVLDAADRAVGAPLLDDEDPDVRRAALDAVRAGDDFALDAVLRSLQDPRFATEAGLAIGRLGDAGVPALRSALATGVATPFVRRLVRAMSTATPARDAVLAEHVGDRDRELGLLVMERLASGGVATPELAAALDAVFADDIEQAQRISVAQGVLAAVAPTEPTLIRALDDELDLVRERVAAGRIARYGRDVIGAAIAALGVDGSNTSLAAEAIEVALGRDDAAVVLALLDPGRSAAHREERASPSTSREADPVEPVLRDLVEDPEDAWRSPWLRACAVRCARRRGVLVRIDTRRARALGNAIVDEELDLAR